MRTVEHFSPPRRGDTTGYYQWVIDAFLQGNDAVRALYQKIASADSNKRKNQKSWVDHYFIFLYTLYKHGFRIQTANGELLDVFQINFQQIEKFIEDSLQEREAIRYSIECALEAANSMTECFLSGGSVLQDVYGQAPKEGTFYKSSNKRTPTDERNGWVNNNCILLQGLWNSGCELVLPEEGDVPKSSPKSEKTNIETEPLMQDEPMDLNNIYTYFKSKGFYFPNEVITSYYLALKTKPFVILTGISGTGKTKIAQLFAEYICQHESPKEQKKRVAFVSVRPDWMDNRGLLGFYNILQEQYIKTPILDILIEAQKEENHDKPYFIILDEMNLAKVEYYFSDFLSLMESRTPDNPKGFPLKLYDPDHIQDEHVPSELFIPPNVFFTGTVNVDESTYMFSPKVLDRANVLEFNQVNLTPLSQSNSGEFDLTEPNVIESFYPADPAPGYFNKQVEPDLDQSLSFLPELLSILEPYHLHFGYRVADEITRFLYHSLNETDQQPIAKDLQILQKILPKFHGTRSKLYQPLQDLLTYCQGQKMTGSAKKLNRMLNSLEHSGYASFIE